VQLDVFMKGEKKEIGGPSLNLGSKIVKVGVCLSKQGGPGRKLGTDCLSTPTKWRVEQTGERTALRCWSGVRGKGWRVTSIKVS